MKFRISECILLLFLIAAPGKTLFSNEQGEMQKSRQVAKEDAVDRTEHPPLYSVLVYFKNKSGEETVYAEFDEKTRRYTVVCHSQSRQYNDAYQKCQTLKKNSGLADSLKIAEFKKEEAKKFTASEYRDHNILWKFLSLFFRHYPVNIDALLSKGSSSRILTRPIDSGFSTMVKNPVDSSQRRSPEKFSKEDHNQGRASEGRSATRRLKGRISKAEFVLGLTAGMVAGGTAVTAYRHLNRSFSEKILSSFSQLPIAPPGFPKSTLLTDTLLSDTMEQFIQVRSEKLKAATWEGVRPPSLYGRFFLEKRILPADSVAEFRGDLHGDIHSLVDWMDDLFNDGWFEKDNRFKLRGEDKYLIFLGDYTDRGHYGSEVLYVIMKLYLENPEQVLLVRGNHEDFALISHYGFIEELRKKSYLMKHHLKLLISLHQVLPVGIYVGTKDTKRNKTDFILSCHGGIHLTEYPTQLLDGESLTAYSSVDSDGEDYPWSQYQWNDFDFFNSHPTQESPESGRGMGYRVSKFDATYAMEQSARKNTVHSIFRAHQHNADTIPHILKYGHGVYRLWSDSVTEANQFGNLAQNKQWNGVSGQQVDIGEHSVWTFNVAPKTGVYKNIPYDTVGRLYFSDNFEDWRFFPRKIPVQKRNHFWNLY